MGVYFYLCCAAEVLDRIFHFGPRLSWLLSCTSFDKTLIITWLYSSRVLAPLSIILAVLSWVHPRLRLCWKTASFLAATCIIFSPITADLIDYLRDAKIP
jgi:hypothetical protein